jgi:Fe2+ transport system protein FeoA/Mn-dependent DtxR family transcriptional regulator
MSGFLNWFLLAVSLLLAALLLWTLLHRRRQASAHRPSAPGSAYRSVEIEDALKGAYALQEAEGAWTEEELAGSMALPLTITREMVSALVASGWAEKETEGGIRLTKQGKQRGLELIRAHRLWERYLTDREQMPLDKVHAEAHKREHETTPEQLERLDLELGHPAWDPHGHIIPAPRKRIPSSPGHSLLDKGLPGGRFRIISLDDEPAAVLAQLAVMGLKPGRDVEVLQKDPGLLQLRVGENKVPIAPEVARHISVFSTPALPLPLGELPVHSRGRVVEIRGAGKHQRRMLDMGFVPGAEVVVLRTAPLGDPVEYRIKGTQVSMRRQDADTVLVEELRNE